MDNIFLYNQYAFQTYSYNHIHHCDNSVGLETHYVARIISGSVKMITNGNQECFFKKGDVFYLPKGMKYHSLWKGCPENEKIEWESYRFTVFPSNSGKVYRAQCIDVDCRESEILDKLSEKMEVTVESVGLFYLLLGSILKKMEEDKNDSKQILLERAKEYISKNPDFKVPQLAKYCNMSESALYAFFRDFGKTSPIEMKNKIKVERAVLMLESTDDSIEKISESLGFSNSAYFRKTVKRYTGMTPMKIRKNAKHI